MGKQFEKEHIQIYVYFAVYLKHNIANQLYFNLKHFFLNNKEENRD